MTAEDPGMAKSAKTADAVVLCLYVAGGAPNSIAAEANLRRCIESLGAPPVEIVNVLIDKARALADGIMVTPTLIRLGPEPRAMLIGNLSDQDALMSFVGR